MSVILKEMAMTMLVKPEAVPSSEAAATALLFSHVAWNRANGDDVPNKSYQSVLADIQESNLDCWKEFTSTNPDTLVAELIVYKKKYYPLDFRKVISCGTINHKVRVEWTE